MTRQQLIRFLVSQGIKKIRGKTLHDCYTFELLRALKALAGA